MNVDVCRVLWVSHYKLAGLQARRRKQDLLKQVLVTNFILKAQNFKAPESPRRGMPAVPNGANNFDRARNDEDLWAFAAALEERLSALELVVRETSNPSNN